MFGENYKSLTRLSRVKNIELMDVVKCEKSNETNAPNILTDSSFIDKLSDSQNVSMKEVEESNDSHFFNSSQLEFL